MKPVIRKRLANIGQNFYDSSKPGDSERSNFWLAFPLTGEKEFTTYNRMNTLRKFRACAANLGLIRAMQDKVGRYAVGRGLFPIPQTRDTPWNIATSQRFDEWASNPNVCDTARMMTFWEMQKWNAETYFGEGETFNGMVNSKKVGAPQIQLFDNGEVEFWPGYGGVPGGANGGEIWWDGCRMNADGTIGAYSIRTQDGGGYVDVDSRNMIHVAKRLRPNQVRGLSPFAPCINCALDIMDTKGLEIATRKLHSFLAMVIRKETGPGIGAGGLTGQLQSLLNVTPTGDQGSQVEVTNAIGENIYAGGAIKHLGVNEQLQVLTSTRETANIVEFLNWLMRDLAVGAGLPIELIWNMADLGGANSRIVLSDGQWFFDSIQDKINDCFNYRVWVWWLSVMIDNGEIKPPDDPEWWKVSWMGPPKLTADAGRAMTAEIAALEAGFGTWEDYYAARGQNWKPKTTQRIVEVAYSFNEATRLKPAAFTGDNMAWYSLVYPPKAGAAAAGATPMGGSSAASSGDPGGGVQG